ncbi:MAG: DUF1800 domain-containing protein [Candidatus Binataceae bacterium]
MLPTTQSFERRAINRVTFGARDLDEAYAQKIGWPAWVAEQLRPSPGDDPDLAAHLAAQHWPMSYPAGNPDLRQTWPAVNEDRPLTYLSASSAQLFKMTQANGFSLHPGEIERVYQELLAATLIRNTHARYQVREFMADFWLNHFNIGRDKSILAATMMMSYDRDIIRPNALGNFRSLLEAVATSASMLTYLDNFSSSAGTPNENYARELQELHTLGGGAYLGTAAPLSSGAVAPGFTDSDIVQASRALSGWTLDFGQAFGGVQLKGDGSFLYSPYQHNSKAGVFLGVDLSGLTADMAQGRAVLDIVAAHPATATFICTKLCRRIFGDAPPQAVIDRAKAAWTANQKAPDQIAKVISAILLGGDEIGTVPNTKLRRPYERVVAMFRTTDMVVTACNYLYLLLSPIGDCLGAWQPPNGRPDVNSYWLSTGPLLAAINLAFRTNFWPEIKTSLLAQAPNGLSTAGLLEYWIGRMIGSEISPSTYDVALAAMSGITISAGDKTGPYAAGLEQVLIRVISLLATTAEFSYR